MLLGHMIQVPIQGARLSSGNIQALTDGTGEPRADSSMERIPMRYLLLFACKVHVRGGCHVTLIVMALVVDPFTSPVIAYLITVRAVVCMDVRHIAYSPAFLFSHSTSVLSSMFDVDPLCLSWHNQWYL